MTEPDLCCEACGRPTKFREVYVTMWIGSDLNIIEEVPAHVCEHCGLQYFDPEIEESIRALNVAGFPRYRAIKHISVPVFSLTEGERDVRSSSPSKPMEHH